MSDSNSSSSGTREIIRGAINGWGMLIFNLALFLIGSALLISTLAAVPNGHVSASLVWLGCLALLAAGLCIPGYFALQPNEARVLILAGAYHGTVRQSGFCWANPFYSKVRGKLSAKISLRARNFNSEKLKVNDKRGNPVEIAAVVVWRVDNTAKAVFDVEDFENYVQIQSESALRHIASLFSYDRANDDETELTLRDSADEVAHSLQTELQVRLAKAGVTVDEARLTHLAYAPEIAQAMLRRQQAEAVIAARTKIVHGAVSMVDMALKELMAKDVVDMDEERKAAMVSNLLVVLCGEAEVTPVVNTGTLYS
ncbi:MAG TPA: SPFH domain-containing protein [Chthoniobacterales bacterium]|jgi:regulator of protease activity HflC (stomatin/prohibitin superfamily)